MKIASPICCACFFLLNSTCASSFTSAWKTTKSPLLPRVLGTHLYPAVRKQKQLPAYWLPSLRGGALEAAKKSQFLVGNLSSAFRALVTRSGTASQKVGADFRLSELVPILFLSFFSEILLRSYHNGIVNTTIRRKKPLPFEDTPVASPLSKILCQIGQLGLLVYAGELLIVFLSHLGVPRLADKPSLLASFVYGLWATRRLSDLKTHLLHRALLRYTANNKRLRSNLSPNKALYNRILDVAIYLVALLIFLDTNRIDVGVALKSILTLGGVSSVVVGLALKEPFTEIVQGTSILLSNKFAKGDVIKLNDGTIGRVQDLDWTDVMMRGNDDSFVRIPHSQLASQRIVNLSRMPDSQVSQVIRVPNKGLNKIQVLIEDIKSEIKLACPKLISYGSRSPLVHWTDIDNDKIVISIETHFHIPRLGVEYWDNRQAVLMAISQAMDKYIADK